MKNLKTTKATKSASGPVPQKLTLTERANAASKYLASVENSVSAFRVATLGDDTERAPLPTSGVSLDATLNDIAARLEVLARETRRINNRLGQ